MSNDKNNLVYREQLDDNVIEMLSEDIGNNYSLRTENTKTIVAALNEILGKDIISNAVGSPLVFDDTFEVMGEKIKGLTNNFKTKLLTLGVSVSGIDKFETLIGKLDEIDLGVDAEDLLGSFIESLSRILEDEDVELSGNETLGELIIKVDEEFNRKNNEIENSGGGLDIISATELPATGRENQICVITNNPVDNFRISNLQTDILNDGNIYLKLGSGSGPSSGNITLGDTVQTIYHVDGIYQNSTKLKSYVYQDGNWIEFTKTGIDIMVNGSYTVDSETYGTLKERSGDITFTDGNGLWMNHGLVSSGRSGYMHTYLTKKIDISGFTKVKITLKDMDYGGTASSNMLATLHFFDSVPTASLLTNPDEDDDYPSKSQSIGRVDFASKNIVYDISDMTGSYYLDFEIYTPSDDEGYYVDVRLTDFSIE